MNQIRTTLLSGESCDFCKRCQLEESFNKVSGRQKQLMRFGLNGGNFEEKWANIDTSIFEYSNEHNGESTFYPYDLQIDLGNLCNAECIMCEPRSSSKLTNTLNNLSSRNPVIFVKSEQTASWALEPEAVTRFIAGINEITRIDYLHFIGGEPFMFDAFYRICEAFIDNGKAKDIILGTATNGSIWNERLEHIFSSFKSAHIGVSIDANRDLNDYLRYPTKLYECVSTLDRALALKRRCGDITVILRPTQTLFGMFYVDELLPIVMPRNITWEACGIVNNPSYLCVEIMPDDLRAKTIEKLYAAATKYGLTKQTEPVVDVRNPKLRLEVISDTVFSLIHFMETYEVPNDVEERRYNLVEYLHGLESVRNNRILDYAPEFADFLRKYGYKN